MVVVVAFVGAGTVGCTFAVVGCTRLVADWVGATGVGVGDAQPSSISTMISSKNTL
jgi:hypothetical protein